MLLLGIETSCDDTATAVVRDGVRVLANVSTNQDEFHAKYGGIVPEIASRRHAALLSAAVDDALTRAGVGLRDVDGIAVTVGPGLIGSLVVGVATAKALAFATGLPLYAVNHLHGHLFAPFLECDDPPTYPFLALLVSGGHSQLVEVRAPTALRIIGKTRDDAAGEAYDKTARLLGLRFPGGPALEALARDGDPKAIAFPRHRPDPATLDMSFSGLKTSVRYFLESERGKAARREDVAASFQAAVVDVLIDRVARALDADDNRSDDSADDRKHDDNRKHGGGEDGGHDDDPTLDSGGYRALVLSGGVAANTALQKAFIALGASRNIPTFVPERRFCTDNAAMIAAAAERRGEANRADPRTLVADPNLPFV